MIYLALILIWWIFSSFIIILSSTWLSVTVMGLGLGRNTPCILNIVTERDENEDDLLTLQSLVKKKDHRQLGNKVV